MRGAVGFERWEEEDFMVRARIGRESLGLSPTK